MFFKERAAASKKILRKKNVHLRNICGKKLK